MNTSTNDHELNVRVDAHQVEISPGHMENIRRIADHLRKPVSDFPVTDLHLFITRNAHSGRYRIKASLMLPKRTFTAGDTDEVLDPALERCVRKLIERVEAYKESLAAKEDIQKVRKGTHQQVIPETEPDGQLLVASVREGKYPAFRAACAPYEDPLRRRVGRWIARYEDVQQRVQDHRLTIDDILEEVFLNAFEHFDQRPGELRFGEWLEHLIDPSVKLLTAHLTDELENISFARSWCETENPFTS